MFIIYNDTIIYNVHIVFCVDFVSGYNEKRTSKLKLFITLRFVLYEIILKSINLLNTEDLCFMFLSIAS